ASHEHMPGSYGHEWQRCRFFPTQTRRLGDHIHSRNCDKLGIAAIASIPEHVVVAAKIIPALQTLSAMSTRNTWLHQHFIAGLHPSRQFSNFAHDSGDIISENMRQRDFNSGQAASRPDIEMIQRTRLNFNQNFVRSDRWLRDIGVLEYLRSTMLAENYGFHIPIGYCSSVVSVAVRERVWRVRSRSSRLLILQESRQGDLPLVDGRGMKTALAGSTARDESPAPFQFRANAQTPQGLHNVRPVDASRKVAGTVRLS